VGLDKLYAAIFNGDYCPPAHTSLVFLRVTYVDICCTNYGLSWTFAMRKWHEEIGRIARLLSLSRWLFSKVYPSVVIAELAVRCATKIAVWLNLAVSIVELTVIIVYGNVTASWLPTTWSNYRDSLLWFSWGIPRILPFERRGSYIW